MQMLLLAVFRFLGLCVTVLVSIYMAGRIAGLFEEILTKLTF